MKKIIGTLLLFAFMATTSVYAQKGKKVEPNEKAKKEATRLGAKLELDEGQKQKVEQASLKRINSVRGKKAQIKALREEVKKHKKEYDNEMKAILSADQYSKWEVIKANKKNKKGKGKSGEDED